MATTFNVGDRVKFAASFIRSIQGHELAPLRGTVTEVIPERKKPGATIPDRLRIQWDDSDGGPESALTKNIAPAGKPDHSA